MKYIAFLFVLSSLMSCTSYKTITLAEAQTLKKGNRVKIILTSGETWNHLKVSSVKPDTIRGLLPVLIPDKGWQYKSRAAAFSGIAQIRKRKFSIAKSAGLLVGIASVPVTIALIQLDRWRRDY